VTATKFDRTGRQGAKPCPPEIGMLARIATIQRNQSRHHLTAGVTAEVKNTDHVEMTDGAERQAGLYELPLFELTLLAVRSISLHNTSFPLEL
jgi:hypothetical protein